MQVGNPTLTTSDLAKITLDQTKTLVAGKPVKDTATITVGSKGKATKVLNITDASTDQEHADAIKNKISQKQIDVPSSTKTDTTMPDTINAIKKALLEANPLLNNDDEANLIFSAATLVKSKPIAVDLTIIYNVSLAKTTIQVTLL